jgi:hypothetical protein
MIKEILAHPWFGTWVAALIAVPLSLLAHRIGGLVLRRITRPAPTIHTMVVNCNAAARFVLPLVALNVVWQGAPDDLRFIDNVRHLNGLLLIAVITWLLVRPSAALPTADRAAPAPTWRTTQARRMLTQTRVLARTAMPRWWWWRGDDAHDLSGRAPGGRQPAGLGRAVIGIVAGLAAKPVFSNLICRAADCAGAADPHRRRAHRRRRMGPRRGNHRHLRGDAIWDERRLIIPLTYFIEKPFQNWTRSSVAAAGLGVLLCRLRHAARAAARRGGAHRAAAPEWDQRFFNLRVTDATERTMQVRVLCTAATSGLAFDLRCRCAKG